MKRRKTSNIIDLKNLKTLYSISPTHNLVYGPVSSRRLGNSLGINVFYGQPKTCSFDCVYCQLGKTDNYTMTADGPWIDVNRIIERTKQFRLKYDGTVDSITLSGDGEPTLYPHLFQLIKQLRGLRDSRFPKTPITILTNASTLPQLEVRRRVTLFDRVIAKLDGGNDAIFRGINRPVQNAPTFEEVVKSLVLLRKEVGSKLVIQALLLASIKPGPITNTTDEAINAFIKVLKRINPETIQLYTLSRKPAESHYAPVHASFLEVTAKKIDRDIHGQVITY